MSHEPSPLQAELMLPHELAQALANRSLAYLPLGSIEWHSAHLPVGLDGLNAHGVCLRAAAVGGGIVLPTLFYGTGGGHTDYPWTIMIEDTDILTAILTRSLTKLQEFGVETAVLFTGHFADEQLAMIDRIAADWTAADNTMKVLACSVNRKPDSSIAPDHAGVFETTLLSSLWPEKVQLDKLPDVTTAPADDPDGNVTGTHRHSPAHPLYGVFGPDPRLFEPDQAQPLLDELAGWLAGLTRAA